MSQATTIELQNYGFNENLNNGAYSLIVDGYYRHADSTDYYFFAKGNEDLGYVLCYNELAWPLKKDSAAQLHGTYDTEEEMHEALLEFIEDGQFLGADLSEISVEHFEFEQFTAEEAEEKLNNCGFEIVGDKEELVKELNQYIINYYADEKHFDRDEEEAFDAFIDYARFKEQPLIVAE